MALPPSRTMLAAAAAVLLVAAISQAIQEPAGTAGHGAVCGSTVEDCMGSTARRELSWGGYIGYDALRRGSVPCSWRGASYYNCRPGAPANPYSRGCSSITQCRG